ncbi:unnamed protein product [Larinioides sclopetarius]|uniref:Saccharopine dehydrogenase-like C-terminal domain-containing protein n=1 Tax=Larinioides sclopetarius TaxID=280406 RepID=A0AAV2A949_9ARAC
MSSFFSALSMIFLFSIFGFFSLFSFGRNLLAKYPTFFTAGMFSSEGPTRKQGMEGSTTVTLLGKGWRDRSSEPIDLHPIKPDTLMKLTIVGQEPAYAFTSRCLVQAGLTIIEETDKLPLEGGVLSPGVAFENTGLIDRLEKRGVTFKFEIVD